MSDAEKNIYVALKGIREELNHQNVAIWELIRVLAERLPQPSCNVEQKESDEQSQNHHQE